MKIKLIASILNLLLVVCILHCSKNEKIINKLLQNKNRKLTKVESQIDESRNLMEIDRFKSNGAIPLRTDIMLPNKGLNFRFKVKQQDDTTNVNILNTEVLTSKP